MNEKLWQLWEETETRPFLNDGSWTYRVDERVEAFAKMILEKCIDICNKGESTQTTSVGAGEAIKEYFK